MLDLWGPTAHLPGERWDRSSAPATVTVAVHKAPLAGNDTVRTNKSTAVKILVLANDSDPDGNNISVTGLTQPANGTAVLNADGTVIYTPKASFSTGTDTFVYKVTDGVLQSNTATVSAVTINTVPTAGSDTATTGTRIRR